MLFVLCWSLGMAVTCRQIQNALWLDMWSRHDFVIPNFTPRSWFEADLFAVTKAGYSHEFEVKLTRADFMRDRAKAHRFGGSYVLGKGWVPHPKTTKHERLENGDPAGPCRFTFVVVDGVIGLDECPSWAGLILATVGRRGLGFQTLRHAPKLHRQKVEPIVMRQAARSFCFRFWDLRRGLKEESNGVDVVDRGSARPAAGVPVE